ncbi:MAG: thermostable hemolysin [Alphaproteobacteria bacterium]|nr:thermostable hemolysin [Alphaproteobacteria bacterium]MCB9930307.1 thermostable hemolysin [Alphaproteobacteria bacterium]
MLDGSALNLPPRKSASGPLWACAATDAGAQPHPGADRRLVLMSRDHPLRRAAEDCIREVYDRAFGAADPQLSETLIVWLTGSGRPLCAAGLRAAPEELFSEAYLDAPIETLLSLLNGRPVARGSVFEITTLAGRSVEDTPAFLRRVLALGRQGGFGWSCFTATARLRRLLAAMGFNPHVLAPASPGRLADPERWGRYYGHDPMVCVAGDPVSDGGDRRRLSRRRAPANA